LNRLSTVTDPAGATTYGYDAVGNLQSFTYPNGVAHTYTYDTLNRLTQLGAAKGSPLSSYTYTLGAAGNRLTVAELTGRTVNYGYDSLYRLTSEAVTADPHSNNFTNGFTYDAVGNRKQWLVNGSVSNTYTYDADDRLGSDTYDANSNTLSDPSGKSYTWDFENRLTQAVNPGVGTTTFRYDPFGRRIQKSGPLGTTNYLYDGMAPGANIIEEVDSSGNVLARYTQDSRVDGPLSMLRGGTTAYYEQDGVNSVTSLTSPAGAVANSYNYDSFGKLTASTGTLTNPFQYTGREFDSETTIYFNRARYYDPSMGRFFSEDPIKFAGGPNFYVYVRNSPVSLFDPSGLDALQGDIQALANIFPGSIPGPNSLTIPMSCKDVRIILLAQGYEDSNSWGYNGPLSAFWDPVYHSGGWEWRTHGPGFHFRMEYDRPNPFKKCSSGDDNCRLDQFHIDPHNPLEPGQMWPHVKCDFFGWC
jgi:RHS repeat-associated protein